MGLPFLHAPLRSALEEGVAALFRNPVSAPFCKTLPDGTQLVMDFRSGSRDPLAFSCRLHRTDGTVEAFDYS